jgi:hypothetical protein
VHIERILNSLYVEEQKLVGIETIIPSSVASLPPNPIYPKATNKTAAHKTKPRKRKRETE